MVAVTKLKHYSKSGAIIYIPQSLLDRDDFPFENGESLSLWVSDGKITIKKTRWFEHIDWSKFDMSIIEELPKEAQGYACFHIYHGTSS